MQRKNKQKLIKTKNIFGKEIELDLRKELRFFSFLWWISIIMILFRALFSLVILLVGEVNMEMIINIVFSVIISILLIYLLFKLKNQKRWVYITLIVLCSILFFSNIFVGFVYYGKVKFVFEYLFIIVGCLRWYNLREELLKAQTIK